MAIQNRRGSFEDFNPAELLAGELAVVQEGDTASTTGRSLYVCFEPGVVKRIADYEDIQDEIQEAAEQYISDISTVASNARTATANAVAATNDANAAAEAAWEAAGSDISNKTVTFSTPSSPSALATGDSLETLIGKIQAYINSRSYVGMIIHSTTLNTMQKVVEQYGGTTWIRHSGYVLYGAITNVSPGYAGKTGGEETHTLTVDEMPTHTHEQDQHKHNLGRRNVYAGNGSAVAVVTYGGGTANDAVTGYTTATNQDTGGGQAHNNMMPYKNVYIWERTA